MRPIFILFAAFSFVVGQDGYASTNGGTKGGAGGTTTTVSAAAAFQTAIKVCFSHRHLKFPLGYCFLERYGQNSVSQRANHSHVASSHW